MRNASSYRHALALVGATLLAALLPSAAMAQEKKIAICHAGIIDLLSFDQHVRNLRGMTRYSRKDIDDLVALQRKGGPDFFSSQVIVQEGPSGSAQFDLRTIHGIEDARHYTNVTAWTCEAKDYPIVYFVGFRVRKIIDDTIFVSREKSTVNVISLSAIDPDLDMHLKVKLLASNKVLCNDIGEGCAKEIFYDRD